MAAPAADSSARPTTPEPIVYVVDDDASIRRLVTWLAEKTGVRVKAFPSAEAFLQGYQPGGPACLVLDLTLGGMDGLSLQSVLKERGIELPIVFMSATGDIPRAVEAVKRGAIDFVVKPFDYRKLVGLIGECLKRSAAEMDRHRESAVVTAGLAALTPREREVMDLVVAGKLNRVIADELAVSIKTVEAHRARIMEKLQVNSVAELVRLSLAARGVPGPTPG